MADAEAVLRGRKIGGFMCGSSIIASNSQLVGQNVAHWRRKKLSAPKSTELQAAKSGPRTVASADDQTIFHLPCFFEYRKKAQNGHCQWRPIDYLRAQAMANCTEAPPEDGFGPPERVIVDG